MKTIKTTYKKATTKIKNIKKPRPARRSETKDYYIAPSTMRGFFNYSI